jgi:hypothetical protein
MVADVRNFLLAENGFDQQFAFGGNRGVSVNRDSYCRSIDWRTGGLRVLFCQSHEFPVPHRIVDTAESKATLAVLPFVLKYAIA